MSRSALKGLQAAAGAAGGGPVYVDDVFSTFLYAGTGNGNPSPAGQTITNNIDLDGEGGLVWIKARDSGYDNVLFDTERGATKYIRSNSTGTEGTATDTLTAFNSNGFTLGDDAANWYVNKGNNNNYASWTFRKQPGFFDIVTYTGTGDTTGGSPTHRNIPHNLGVAPGMIITKRLDSAQNWYTWHRGVSDDSAYFASSGFINLTADFGGYQGFATNANQTSTHFAVRQNSDTADQTNRLGATYVAYLFAHDAQDFGTDSDEAIIKCDTYTGNGSSTGPTVNLGFEPQFLLIKSASSGDAWGLFDSMRGISSNNNDAYLQAQASDQEYDNQAWIDLTATGFQLKNSHDFVNGNGNTYIYMAIRRPHKPASEFAATALLGLDKPTSGGKPTPGFPADFGFAKNTTGAGAWYVGSRLTQGFYNNFSSTGSESSASGYSWDSMTQFFHGYSWADYMSYGFRRAPGFMDVVVYKGTNSATTISHNLGVAPEMIFLKNRGATEDWQLYLNAGGVEYGYYGTNQKYVGLNTSLGPWNSTSPTDSVVSIASGLSNASYSYVMYLFASVSGISKIGTYTGTGSELAVDCGFSAGARFVLITRVDSSMGSGGESWFLFDTVQGITASSSPYFVLNDSDAPVTGSFIKPDSSGFKVTSQSVVNTSGKTYVFYAIA